jgi:hypothetical protein
MTDSAPTKPVERCADCERPKAKYPSDWRRDECRAHWYVDSLVANTFRNEAQHLLPCQRRTIARLRSENATLRERNQLEAAVVDRALDWRMVQGPTPVEFACEGSLLEAVDALLAHRAQKGADYGNG